MNEWISEKRTVVMVGLAVLFLLLAIFYYFILLPVKERVKEEEKAIQFEQELIATMTKGAIDRGNQEEENTIMLERRVPIQRAVDEYLLSLQEVEMVTGTLINSISFNQYDGELTEADEQYTIIEEWEEFVEESRSIGRDDKEEEVEEETVEEHPKEVRSIQLSLNVTTPNYESLMHFLKEMEQKERITNIHAITFSTPREADLLFSEEDINLSFTIDLSIYYYQK